MNLVSELRLRLSHRKIQRHARRLQQMVDDNLKSFKTQDYAKRRKAALKFTRGIEA